METRIVKDKITREELRAIANEQYGDIKMTVSKERWFTLTLAEQLGNIGSEVGRARSWAGKDESSFWGAVTRALVLLDLTQADPRWTVRRKELDRARESFADAVLGGEMYGSRLSDLENYFMQFALISTLYRHK